MNSQNIRLTFSAFLITIMFMAITENANAQIKHDMISLWELSFNELTDMEVVVASDRLEKTSDAPGTVTAYSFQDINRFGYYNLAQLAEFTTAYSVSQQRNEDYTLETRGGTASLNEKHLVRIDGIPVNHVRNNSAPVLNNLPLFFAERTEILRGPASALYGIGAFNGVINLVPKTMKKENGSLLESYFGYGQTFSSELNGLRNSQNEPVAQKRAMINFLNKNDNIEFDGSFGYYTNSADLLTDQNSGLNDLKKKPVNYNNHENIFSRFSQKFNNGPLEDFTLGMIYLKDYNGYGLGWNGNGGLPNMHQYQTIIGYVKHDLKINSTMNTESYLKFNSSQEKGSQSNQAGWWFSGSDSNSAILEIKELKDSNNLFVKYDTIRVNKVGNFQFDVWAKNFEFLSKLDWDFSDKLSVTTGVNYDVRWQDSSLTWTSESGKNKLTNTLYDEKYHTLSFFTQLRDADDLIEGMIITGGLRMDLGYIGENNYQQISPRIAVIQKLNPNLNAKLMYGSALKAPGILDYSHNLEKSTILQQFNDSVEASSQIKLPQLKAETQKTLEANLTYTNEDMYISFSGYSNVIENAIQRKYFEGIKRGDTVKVRSISDFVVNTSDNTKSWGFELESQYSASKEARIWLNSTYTQTSNDNGDPVLDIPLIKTNIGVNYFLSEFHTNVFFVAKLIPRYSTKSGKNLATFSDGKKGQTTFDLTIKKDLSLNLKLGLAITNLTDQEYKTGGPFSRRAAMVSLESRF